MLEIQTLKQRFGIIGFSPRLDRAIDVARQVAATDITVLITGESGTGKEVFPKIIHQLSPRKHGHYIAVNCGAIPEGTIDSELFGHEKGAFTGAHDARKGYFEVVNGGTIFLDEVAELPLLTQVRLLRVLESGEFIRVGSSKVQKTDVRVVAATNVNLQEAITSGKFREDLFYRLNTVPIHVPPLRDRKDDIVLLFRKFSSDFAERYRMPPLQLTPDAEDFLMQQHWSGNVRQLKNLAEQISVIESKRTITADIILKYMPPETENRLPVLLSKSQGYNSDMSERDILYKLLFDMRRDITDMKKIIGKIVESGQVPDVLDPEHTQILQKLYEKPDLPQVYNPENEVSISTHQSPEEFEAVEEAPHEVVTESLSIYENEKDLILKALQKYHGRRKRAAEELGISERTLYRKIKEYGIG
ncbi:MAG: sigma-54-dependent Fis family transcriptional regulator [Bacteroidales bacterium]|jgi:transcriptional regulator with PAS, ATPase and Fis domain|nr:sigma-54-dependent Fis family transcriptional regulator [Bacteroidales bacterium]